MKNKENNKSFGILFFIVFMLIAVWPVFESGSLRVWAIAVSSLFLFLGIINSKILTPLKTGWIKLGEILGKVVAPIVMGFIYFIIITPIGIFMRLIGKDLLNIKFNKNKSYWIKRVKNVGTMKRQFWMLSFFKEFYSFLKERKKYWLVPIIIVLVLFGALIVLSQGSVVAPFIYTLF